MESKIVFQQTCQSHSFAHVKRAVGLQQATIFLAVQQVCNSDKIAWRVKIEMNFCIRIYVTFSRSFQNVLK